MQPPGAPGNMPGQIGMPAGPGYIQPTPKATPVPNPGFTGGLKPAPVNYRPPAMTQQQIAKQVGLRPNPVQPRTAQRTVYGPRAY